MKIALIGATGNIGAKILNEAVERGHQVTGIARDVAGLEGRNNVTTAQCDIADEDGDVIRIIDRPRRRPQNRRCHKR